MEDKKVSIILWQCPDQGLGPLSSSHQRGLGK